MYFNPLPPHGGRLIKGVNWAGGYIISIHSLRMEGDSRVALREDRGIYFNPLPPHGGRRTENTCMISSFYFNPLPPHGGRL